MSQLLPRRLVLPVTAPIGNLLLLHARSRASSDATTDLALASAASPTPTKRTTGTAADALVGMQGHIFGEPLRNYTGCVLFPKEDERVVRVYQVPTGQERGWFDKLAVLNLVGGVDWEEKRVMYSPKRVPSVQCWRSVYSKPLRLVQQAKQRANAGS